MVLDMHVITILRRKIPRCVQPCCQVYCYSKTSVGRSIVFGCATRCHLSVHSLAMPRSGPDDGSHGGGGGGRGVGGGRGGGGGEWGGDGDVG